MIAGWVSEHTDDAITVIVAAGLLFGGVGYLLSSIKSGKRKDAEEKRAEVVETLDIANREIELLKSTLDRREATIDTLQRQLTGLVEEVSALRAENSELRKLVMGERVPDALFKAMMKVAADEGKLSRELMEKHHQELLEQDHRHQDQVIEQLNEQHHELTAFLAQRCPVFDTVQQKFVHINELKEKEE